MIWNTTPPMAPGWFTASTCEPRNTNFNRYWNGRYWSAPIHHEDMRNRSLTAHTLTTRGETQNDVVWLHPATEAKFCMCGDGKCCASPEGLRIGRVSTISDLVCKAVSPPAPTFWDRFAEQQRTDTAEVTAALERHLASAVRGKSVPQEIREADAAVTLAARLVDTRGMLSEQTLRRITAVDMLNAAAKHISDRAAAYDKPEGERSMAQTVVAFNAVTGHNITESQGWFFMECLKAVRDFTTAGGHADSQEDRTAYSALGAEARRAGR